VADEQQLALIKQGVDAWNERRPFGPVDLRGVDLSGASLDGADLHMADLSEALLDGASLAYADLNDANLTSASLRRADLNRSFLRWANLSHANLAGAILCDANLTEAVLGGATLEFVNLFGAHAVGANFIGASLSHANLTYMNLNEANLADASLDFANLTRAGLTLADLTRARCGHTVLADVNLNSVKGLESIDHLGPSTVDHFTLGWWRPPDSFLRGCGLPEGLIDYLPSLLNAGPIQFYSCFISYSTANQEFAERLHADLQARGVRCWFAPHDMEGGKRIHDQIDEAIRIHDRLLLILSRESMSSRWVKTEIEKARAKELRSNRNVLFPLALVPFSEIQAWRQFDADLGEDTARTVRDYFIPDFSGWKVDHGRYLASFEKLLASLKNASSVTPGGEAAGTGHTA
jgi:uncharacterized protein YjbI with pentapeptide repeats